MINQIPKTKEEWFEKINSWVKICGVQFEYQLISGGNETTIAMGIIDEVILMVGENSDCAYKYRIVTPSENVLWFLVDETEGFEFVEDC